MELVFYRRGGWYAGLLVLDGISASWWRCWWQTSRQGQCYLRQTQGPQIDGIGSLSQKHASERKLSVGMEVIVGIRVLDGDCRW
jgi:hypothetical protein